MEEQWGEGRLDSGGKLGLRYSNPVKLLSVYKIKVITTNRPKFVGSVLRTLA